MGRLAEVYNTEMLALLRGLELAIELQQEMLQMNRKWTKIILFADNTALITAITKEAPGLSQQTSQKFIKTTITFLDKNRQATIEVSWVPGHMEIEGNNRADKIAKEATNLKPTTETITLVKLYQQICKNLKIKWTGKWATKPITG